MSVAYFHNTNRWVISVSRYLLGWSFVPACNESFMFVPGTVDPDHDTWGGP